MELTPRDIDELRRDPSTDARRRVVGEVGRAFAAGALSARARQEALAIVRVVVEDVEVVVRQAMAEALCAAPDLPRDVALALASDVFDVARPILEASQALSEDDLVALVRDPVCTALRVRLELSGNGALDGEAERRHLAVARRETVSGRVSQVLIEEGTAAVAATVLANEGAAIGETTAHLAIDRFGTERAVQAALVDRAMLPVTVVERLMFLVSEALRARIQERHNISPRLISGLARQARERATLDLIKGDHAGTRSIRLAAGLERQGRLTPTLVLRALCVGEVQFAEAALTQLSGLRHESVHNRLRHGSALDLKDLTRRARFPASLTPLLEQLFSRAYQLGGDPSADGRGAFTEQMTAALAELSGLDSHAAGADGLDYLLMRLERPPAPASVAR